jgi:formate hydrogenlyase transcriptional activator
MTEISGKKVPEAVRDLDDKLRKEMNRLQVLTDINALLSSNWDVPLVFPTVSSHIRRVLQQELASFVLYNPEKHELVRHAIDFPLSKGLIARSPVSAKNNPAETALQKRTSVIFSKKQLQNFRDEITSSLLAEGLQSLCCVPMMRPKGPLGVLILGSTRHNAFHNDDLALLSQVANQLALAMENHLAASEIKVLKQRLGEERQFLQGEIEYEGHFADIVGKSAGLRKVLEQVTTVASSDANVLILGETGTGKELIARAIHRLSRRKDGSFIKVNCAAIPTGLLESELFGHEKGAFTGAVSQKIGRMELADGGTLFLDEIGEIPLELQPKLLRVLQDKEFERLGGNRTIRVNLRLIAATNRNLAEDVSQHQFRSDLYYRLSVFPILIPPLRERVEDIPLLVRYFVRQCSHRMNRSIESIPHRTMEALLHWKWPGNVRELGNFMERSVILSEGTVLRAPLSELQATPPEEPDPTDQTLDSAERQHILRVLRETRGVLSGAEGAAVRLGLKRTTLQSKMQRLRITRQDYQDPTQQ